MNAGPPGPPFGQTPPSRPDETPPSPPSETPSWAPAPAAETPPSPPRDNPPATPSETPSWLPPPAAETPTAAEYQAPGEGAPPSYYPPPGEAMAQPSKQRNVGAIIAVVLVVVVLVAAIGAYLVAGVAYAQNRLSSANTAYNTVVHHQNDLNSTINGLSDKFTGADATSTSQSDLQSAKSLLATFVRKSQDAQGQIATDDKSLATADQGLKENQWLTLLRKGEMDKESTRIGHARKALAAAKTITADYVQIGTFYQAFFDVLIDEYTLGTKAQAQDLTGVAAADEKLKTDVAKAITLDKAPGVPTAVDGFLKDTMQLANDFSALLNARTQAAVDAAEKALQADLQKIEAVDWTKVTADVDGFYKPLIDEYNSEVDKANAT